MKKLIIIASLFFGLSACNSNSSTEKVTQSDTTGTKNPDGIVNSSVISTDSLSLNNDSSHKNNDTMGGEHKDKHDK